MDNPRSFTEMLISKAIDKFTVPRKESHIYAGGRMMRVHKSNERIIYLPNGAAVKVSVDDSGITTQVEEDESLHGIVRPPTFHQKIRGR